jgi:hypothetical protein
VEIKQILAELEQEINRLKEARALLAGDGAVAPRRGRPPRKLIAVPKTRKKHNLSPEGRKRISEALKRRWAVQRKASKPARAA